MKYLIAPTAYKGFFSPSLLSLSIRQGIEQYDPSSEFELAPIADGGDGTIEALQIATGGTLQKLAVRGAIGQQVEAQWLVLDGSKLAIDENSLPSRHGLAVVELASACGLAHLSQEQLAALDSNTIGAGEVLEHCRQLGYSNIVLTVGGSASTDGGMGILSALGAKFYDSAGVLLPASGRTLLEIASVDLSALESWKKDIHLRVATDVVNVLLGDFGAANMFAPQKGASINEVAMLESGLLHYADLMERVTGKTARNLEGAGAAGGVAFGLTVAINAKIIPGFRWIANVIGLEEKIKNADVVISAEGKLDYQSISGKATGELARLCALHAKQYWILPAQVEDGIDWTVCGVQRVLATAQAGQIATLSDVTHAAYRICSELNA